MITDTQKNQYAIEARKFLMREGITIGQGEHLIKVILNNLDNMLLREKDPDEDFVDNFAHSHVSILHSIQRIMDCDEPSALCLYNGLIQNDVCDKILIDIGAEIKSIIKNNNKQEEADTQFDSQEFYSSDSEPETTPSFRPR